MGYVLLLLGGGGRLEKQAIYMYLLKVLSRLLALRREAEAGAR